VSSLRCRYIVYSTILKSEKTTTHVVDAFQLHLSVLIIITRHSYFFFYNNNNSNNNNCTTTTILFLTLYVYNTCAILTTTFAIRLSYYLILEQDVCPITIVNQYMHITSVLFLIGITELLITTINSVDTIMDISD